MRRLKPAIDYNPQYMLGSLGAGGIAVTFFIYLMFMIKHPKRPMVTFDEIYPQIINSPFIIKILIIAVLIAIVFFAFLHFRYLIWNLKNIREFKKTYSYQTMMDSNGEISMMVIPLTLAMSINVGFILGAVFIPKLWTIVEYLFPGALLAFFAVAYYAVKIFFNYFLRLLEKGGFNETSNNNFSQLIAIFAFSMIAVGFAAPGAMSHTKAFNAIGLFFSATFLTVAIMLMLIQYSMAFRAMMTQGIAEEAVPTIWVLIPIFTLWGITIIRYINGLSHHFEFSFGLGAYYIFTSAVVGIQLMFGLFGFLLMIKIGYFKEYLFGEKKHASSFALICPGVAFFVFGMFFINFGMVSNKIIQKFTAPYYLMLIPFFLIQVITIVLYLKLNKCLLTKQ